MSMSDPIADMLTRIRNGSRIGKESVSMPASGTKAIIRSGSRSRSCSPKSITTT